jgi:hypothetical protein
MDKKFEIKLTLNADTPNSIGLEDCAEGLKSAWYKITAERSGEVTVFANPDGFEYLARLFLKFARCPKAEGFHIHEGLEFGHKPPDEGPELTIGVSERPKS